MHQRKIGEKIRWLEKRIAELEARPVIIFEGEPLLAYHIAWLRTELAIYRTARRPELELVRSPAELEAEARAAAERAARSAELRAARKVRKNAKAKRQRELRRHAAALVAA
jgi:hypothetical protein